MNGTRGRRLCTVSCLSTFYHIDLQEGMISTGDLCGACVMGALASFGRSHLRARTPLASASADAALLLVSPRSQMRAAKRRLLLIDLLNPASVHLSRAKDEEPQG